MEDETDLKPRAISELADYQKVRLLGYGGFGKVYLVQHSITGIKCAAKEQKSSKFSKEEATVLKRLENQEVSIFRKMISIQPEYYILTYNFINDSPLFSFTMF